MAGEFSNRLKAMEDHWKTGKDAQNGVPDGKYSAQLHKAELRESNGGKLMVAREHVIVGGSEYDGTTVRDYISLETEFGPANLAKWIELMGYTIPEQVEEIEDVVSAIAVDAPQVSIQVKKAKDSDFINVTVLALITGSAAEVTAPAKKPSVAPAKAAKAPATAPAVVSAKVKADVEKAVATANGGISIGNVVTFSDGTTDYEGEVTAITKGIADIKSGEDVYEVAVKDLTLKEEVAEEAVAEQPAEEEDTTVLIAFAQSQGVEGIVDDDTRAEIIEKINAYEFTKAELTKEEVELVESIGGTFKAVVAPAPKKTVAPKAAAPVVAAKKTTTPPAATSKAKKK